MDGYKRFRDHEFTILLQKMKERKEERMRISSIEQTSIFIKRYNKHYYGQYSERRDCTIAITITNKFTYMFILQHFR